MSRCFLVLIPLLSFEYLDLFSHKYPTNLRPRLVGASCCGGLFWILPATRRRGQSQEYLATILQADLPQRPKVCEGWRKAERWRKHRAPLRKALLPSGRQ